MRRRALSAAFTALVAEVGAFGVRLVTADAAPISFSHPGVLVSRAQLDFVKGKVSAGSQPWLAAYHQMMASSYASLARTPKPRATVECGSYSNSQQYTELRRPQGTNNLFVAWETLTHASNPA